jgi:5-methylcytosine-specific restriction endonuclease McrA
LNWEQKSRQRKQKYYIYLQSPQWNIIRNQILDRDKHRCQVCDKTNELHVHHMHYKNIFHEQLGDLITLCERCHGVAHRTKPPLPIEYIKDYVNRVPTVDELLNKMRELFGD